MTFRCSVCNRFAKKTGHWQKYCRPCGKKKEREAQRRHSKIYHRRVSEYLKHRTDYVKNMPADELLAMVQQQMENDVGHFKAEHRHYIMTTTK